MVATTACQRVWAALLVPYARHPITLNAQRPAVRWSHRFEPFGAGPADHCEDDPTGLMRAMIP